MYGAIYRRQAAVTFPASAVVHLVYHARSRTRKFCVGGWVCADDAAAAVVALLLQLCVLLLSKLSCSQAAAPVRVGRRYDTVMTLPLGHEKQNFRSNCRGPPGASLTLSCWVQK